MSKCHLAKIIWVRRGPKNDAVLPSFSFVVYLVCFRLVLRLLPPDAKAQCQLGMKYGCHLRDVKQLLEKAKELELKVIGIR